MTPFSRITVWPEFYEAVQEKDEITLQIREGAIGYPWVEEFFLPAEDDAGQ